MNKKIIAVIIAIIVALVLIKTCGAKKEEVKITPENEQETLVSMNEEKEQIEQVTEQEEDEYVDMEEEEEELLEPKVDENKGTAAAKIEKVKVNENIKEEIYIEESQEDFFYIVRPGDTLWSLSLEYYMDPYNFKNLAEYNAIEDAEKIYPGKKIMFPGKIINRDYIYTVVSGDNLWNIAGKIYGNNHMWKFIAGYNGIDIEKRVVWPGMRLRIPNDLEKYVAQEGEDMFKVSKKVYKSPVFALRLAKYNNIDYLYYVKPGTEIYYPVLDYRK